jgi:hypothetical protein
VLTHHPGMTVSMHCFNSGALRRIGKQAKVYGIADDDP